MRNVIATSLTCSLLLLGASYAAEPGQTQTATPEAAPATEVPSPVMGTVMHPGYAMTVGRMAYVWGWPMVNMLNRSKGVTQAPHPARLNGVLPVAPRGRVAMLTNYIDPGQTFVACPNQDVVYGLGFFSLDKEPVVAQVPDFGGRFWTYALYDARTGQFSKLGKQHGSKPGFYLIAGPNWNGKVPDGIAGVIRSSTALANAIPRVFMEDTPEDRQAIQPLINQIVFYPLSEYDGKMKTVDWSRLPSITAPKPSNGSSGLNGTSGWSGSNGPNGGTRWVAPDKFFDQLGEVLQTVPPLPGEEALYDQFRVLLDAASQDPQIKRALIATATEAERQVIVPFVRWAQNGRPAGNGWNRSTNNARYGTDYFNRTGTAKSNMFDNAPEETQYFYTDDDSKGEPLDGGNSYEITFKAGALPPVNGFWSLTVYNEQHFFHRNRLNRYSLGTKTKSLKLNTDGSLTLYAGARSPGNGKEANWLPAPNGPFSLYIRAYWGQAAILDGSWTPPAITRVQLIGARYFY